MNSKYKVTKFSSKNFSDTEDLISIEEPLEISLKYKTEDKWINQNLSITMRTPGHDEDLVTGFLFNEQIITSLEDIASVESFVCCKSILFSVKKSFRIYIFIINK